MSKILFATVPLTGHVNPGIPLAHALVEKGHQLCWYSGEDFRGIIEKTGACFLPFKIAQNFNDVTISKKHLGVTKFGALRQGIYYFKKVFYGQMINQSKDIEEILKSFHADLILTDWMFMGALPLVWQNKVKWAVFSNSPLFYLSDDAPPPGGGILPDGSNYGKYRNRTVNWLIRHVLFLPVQNYLNKIRKSEGLPPVSEFFLDHNVNICKLFLQFSTLKFEYKRKNLPSHVHFVGPIHPPVTFHNDFEWWHKLTSGKPVVFITQGTLDTDNINKLVIPALNALQKSGMILLVTTAGRDASELKKQFDDPDIIIEKYIPYSIVMPYVNVLISNGGFGGVVHALSYGVPVVVAGNSEEKRDVATRLEYSGAGLNLKTGTPKPGKIKKAVDQILQQPEYKQKALEIQSDFDQHNSVFESVMLIEKVLNN